MNSIKCKIQKWPPCFSWKCHSAVKLELHTSMGPSTKGSENQSFVLSQFSSFWTVNCTVFFYLHNFNVSYFLRAAYQRGNASSHVITEVKPHCALIVNRSGTVVNSRTGAFSGRLTWLGKISQLPVSLRVWGVSCPIGHSSGRT